MSLRLAVASEDFAPALRRAVPRAARAQVDGLRLNVRRQILDRQLSVSGIRQLQQFVREHRMDIAALTCPTRHALAAAEYLEERIQLIRSAMEVARPLQTDRLLVPIGLIPDPDAKSDDAPTGSTADDPFGFASGSTPTASAAKQFETLCEVANDLAAFGNHVGCILTLQLPVYDSARISRLLEKVTAGPLELCFDPAVVVFGDGDVVEMYRNLYQSIGDVRARDGVRNLEMSGTEMPVGEGIVGWDEFLPTLLEADYRGWLCVERTAGDHREIDVLKGVAHLRSLLPPPPDTAP